MREGQRSVLKLRIADVLPVYLKLRRPNKTDMLRKRSFVLLASTLIYFVCFRGKSILRVRYIALNVVNILHCCKE